MQHQYYPDISWIGDMDGHESHSQLIKLYARFPYMSVGTVENVKDSIRTLLFLPDNHNWARTLQFAHGDNRYHAIFAWNTLADLTNKSPCALTVPNSKTNILNILIIGMIFPKKLSNQIMYVLLNVNLIYTGNNTDFHIYIVNYLRFGSIKRLSYYLTKINYTTKY